jgi:hypothetical protein
LPPTEAALPESPELESPGLNVNVAASLLGQFGNDTINLERVEERRIEEDQSDATPIRFSLRQTARQGRLNCSTPCSLVCCNG